MRRSADPAPRLLLDEMFSPAIAALLGDDGFDVVAVAGHPVLAVAADEEVLRWAVAHGYCVLTENVRDFQPLLAQVAAEGISAALLFTSSRRFPQSRRNLSPLHGALRAWLADPDRSPVVWLR